MSEVLAQSPWEATAVEALVNIDAYPLEDLAAPRCRELIAKAKEGLRNQGSFTLEGFLRPAALADAVAEVEPMMARESFHHAKEHNIYFDEAALPAAAAPVLAQRLSTSNHTLTCDQLAGGVIHRVYSWDPLRHFLAAVLEKPALYRMDDPLAALNVMGYGAGDRISWHFDRAEFTVTLPLQMSEGGGVFRYRRNLRRADEPNYEGVARLLAGDEDEVRILPLPPGSLNVFAGFRSPHCVTPVEGKRMRLIAILSFMERAGVTFSPEDRIQFYGRSEPR